MPVVTAVFVLVAGVIIGAYWLFILRPEQLKEAAVRRRVAGAQPRAKKRLALLKRQQQASSIPAFDRALARTASLKAPVELLIEQSGARMNVATFLLLTAFCGLLAFLGVTILTHWMLLGLAAGPLAAMVPYQVLKFKRERRIRKFEEQFPEAIDLIARALRAGHAFPAGLSMVAEEMAAPVGPEFQTLYDQQNYGMPLPEAMRNFAQRVPLLDARFFVTAVLAQRESGGNLAEVLDNLAAVIRERFKVKRQVRVISAHGRITGWVLVALPPSLAMAFMIIGPQQIGKLTGTSLGHKMIFTGIALQLIGTLIIRKIIRIEY